MKHVVGIPANNTYSGMPRYTFTLIAPYRALCLRFAAALWPKRHKSYTSVIGARNVNTRGIHLRILNEDLGGLPSVLLRGFMIL
jgi:hypothetical protein